MAAADGSCSQLVPFPTVSQAVLVAVTLQSHPTVRSVAEYAGVGLFAAHRHLLQLRQLGLVSWEDGRTATLRSLVRIVPIPLPSDPAR